jgi:hypothetical protein
VTFQIDALAILFVYTSRFVNGEIVYDFRCWYALIGDEL